ncbi:hypothetical protein CUMW_212630, partial [Citrus unshiu]
MDLKKKEVVRLKPTLFADEDHVLCVLMKLMEGGLLNDLILKNRKLQTYFILQSLMAKHLKKTLMSKCH